MFSFAPLMSYQTGKNEGALFSEVLGIGLEGRVHWSGRCGRHCCLLCHSCSSLPFRSELTSLPQGKPFLACLPGWDALAGQAASGLGTFFSTCPHCSFTLESWFLSLAQLTFRARWFFNVGGCPVPCGTWPRSSLAGSTLPAVRTALFPDTAKAPWGQTAPCSRSLVCVIVWWIIYPPPGWFLAWVQEHNASFISPSGHQAQCVTSDTTFIYWEWYVIEYQSIKKCMAYELNQ